MSRMKEDLLTFSQDLHSSFQPRTATRNRARTSYAETPTTPYICIIGAGLAGLRCAEILASGGAKVTILEGRDRIGGRIHQSNLLGVAVDMGPNWVHGTDDNPIVKLAEETNTTLCLVDESTCVYDPQGQPMTKDAVTTGSDEVWRLIEDVFRYSNETCLKIPPNLSLKDFFLQKLAERPLCQEDRDRVLLLAEMWGSFIGDPWEQQSLRWFWLEECLDGDNLFAAGTHAPIVRHVASKALANAEIHFSTVVKAVETLSNEDGDPKVLIKTHQGSLEFDEVVVAVPLGCLKAGTPAFTPPLPPRIGRAIGNASYSSLEKVYIAFAAAFWDGSASDGEPPATATPKTDSAFPSFAHFLRPTYVPEDQKFWTLEVVPLSSPTVFGSHSQPTLLFYTYGPCAAHVSSLIRALSPTSQAYFTVLDDFFRPYYSRLPNYNPGSPDCKPSAILATDWHNDDLAGNGSYTNFQVSEDVGERNEQVLLDEDVRQMRTGLPEQGLWFAGEHTAPFVALGTTTGAYWSGEGVGMRILAANGLLGRAS